MKNENSIGDTLTAIVSVGGITTVAVSNNIVTIQSWAQSVHDFLHTVQTPNMPMQVLIGFIVVSAIGYVFMPKGESKEDDPPATGVGYRQRQRLRTASDFRKLTEV